MSSLEVDGQPNRASLVAMGGRGLGEGLRRQGCKVGLNPLRGKAQEAAIPQNGAKPTSSIRRRAFD